MDKAYEWLSIKELERLTGIATHKIHQAIKDGSVVSFQLSDEDRNRLGTKCKALYKIHSSVNLEDFKQRYSTPATRRKAEMLERSKAVRAEALARRDKERSQETAAPTHSSREEMVAQILSSNLTVEEHLNIVTSKVVKALATRFPDAIVEVSITVDGKSVTNKRGGA